MAPFSSVSQFFIFCKVQVFPAFEYILDTLTYRKNCSGANHSTSISTITLFVNSVLTSETVLEDDPNTWEIDHLPI